MGFTMKKIKINEKYRKKCCDDVTDFRELEHDWAKQIVVVLPVDA